jgi:hypothetical protein
MNLKPIPKYCGYEIKVLVQNVLPHNILLYKHPFYKTSINTKGLLYKTSNLQNIQRYKKTSMDTNGNYVICIMNIATSEELSGRTVSVYRLNCLDGMLI